MESFSKTLPRIAERKHSTEGMERRMAVSGRAGARPDTNLE